MAFPFLRHSGTLPRLCGLLVILATGALFALVGCFALPVLWSAQGSLIFSWAWRPPADFGILPMLAGSLILSFSALLLAWPLSLGLACALQDPRPAFWQKWLTGLIRFMTAIPTVVYGFAAVSWPCSSAPPWCWSWTWPCANRCAACSCPLFPWA